MKASGHSLWESMRIVTVLGWADFRLKYRGSALGFSWSFAMPLLRFLVMYHVARPFADSIPSYALYLFFGISMWEYFSLTTTACVHMLRDKAAVIQKIRFPPLLLVLSVGWLHLLLLAGYLILLFAALWWMAVPLQLSTAYLAVSVLQVVLLSLGVGMLLSAYALRYRDIPHIWSVLLQLLFWLTPIVYRTVAPIMGAGSAGLAGNAWSLSRSIVDVIVRYQPLSLIVADGRQAVLYATSVGVPSMVRTLEVSTICAAIFCIGAVVFLRRSRYFLEEY